MSFKFLPFSQLTTNLENLLKDELKAHSAEDDVRKLTQLRYVQLELLDILRNELEKSDLLEEERSVILTGAETYIEEKIRESYSGVWALVSKPENSVLCKGLKPAMGVTSENELDDVSKKEALFAFRNFAIKCELLRKVEEERKAAFPDSIVGKVINLKPDLLLTTFLSDLSAYIRPELNAANIAKVQLKGKHAYWKDEIKSANISSLNHVATVVKQETEKLRMTDIENDQIAVKEMDEEGKAKYSTYMKLQNDIHPEVEYFDPSMLNQTETVVKHGSVDSDIDPVEAARFQAFTLFNDKVRKQLEEEVRRKEELAAAANNNSIALKA